MKITHKKLPFAAFACVLVATGVQAQTSQSGDQQTVATNIGEAAVTGAAIETRIAMSPGASAGNPIPFPDNAAAKNPVPSDDGGWHLAVSPYLWLAGTHGTVGVLGREASFKASASDLLSSFRFGLMGVVDARHGRWVMPTDLIWIRLKDDKALPIPFPNFPEKTATVKIQEFILTPKVGYRMVDLEKLKFDGLVGFRYWHMGQNLTFTPSKLGVDVSGSQNWVDPLVGARMEAMLAPKVEATIAGDVGGGGVQSQLAYQIAGALGYRIKPKLTLQAGYRYMFFDYRPGGSSISIAMSGIMVGATIKLK
jgi:hypothetical protein